MTNVQFGGSLQGCRTPLAQAREGEEEEGFPAQKEKASWESNVGMSAE